ncbi:hypothetical protein Tco_1523692 [Tanacetum coccineum]
MESVISRETAKAAWTNLVHSFKDPSDTKENRIKDLKLEYQTFRSKPSKMSKHEINVGFMSSLPEKWLSFPQRVRNANHTQTLDLVDIYGRFVYEENLISRRYPETKKALKTAPSVSPGHGVVKPEIRGNVNFKIKSHFMRESREDSFSWNKNDDAYEHVERVLDIVSLFNILGVTHDAVMLRVFPITLTGATKRCVDRLSPGTINTWDLLKNAFIQRYCPPYKTAKQLEEIHKFKQEGDESLYQAWERYNDLLYKCPTYDLNSHQKVNIFYNGLDTMTRQLLDSHGPIPNKTPTQTLTTIQTMADHSQKWHDGLTSRRGSNDSYK